MLKIAIEETDALFRNGFEMLLKELFMDEECHEIYIQELDSFNVSNADVIVKNYTSGMHFVCQPMIRRRKPNNLIIGLYEGTVIPDFTLLPLCISNIVFINRNDSVLNIQEKIRLGWQRCNTNPHHVNHMSCLSCRHRSLTRQQVVIAGHFYRGYSPQQMAKILNINPKTVCAHKRAIMDKFNLSSDCELLIFCNSLIKNKYSAGLFKIAMVHHV